MKGVRSPGLVTSALKRHAVVLALFSLATASATYGNETSSAITSSVATVNESLPTLVQDLRVARILEEVAETGQRAVVMHLSKQSHFTIVEGHIFEPVKGVAFQVFEFRDDGSIVLRDNSLQTWVIEPISEKEKQAYILRFSPAPSP